MTINLPLSDIVNAPLSERIEVAGECSSMTYTIMPTTSSFRTEVIINLLPSDIVNAPLSERIEVGGECSAMTYTILGTLPYAGKNGGGLPDPNSATGEENALRRVMPGTLMSHVFDVVCRKL